MQIRIAFLIIVFLIVSCLTAKADQEFITLRYPPDKVIMEFGLLNISLNIPEGSADLVKANVNDRETVNIVPDLEYECFSVPLVLGINKIDIVAMKEGIQVYNVTLSVFRRSDLVGEYVKTPAGFQKDYFHMKNSLQCAECHILKPREFDKKPISPMSFTAVAFDKQTVLAATSTCYSCHKKIASYPFVHGPVAVWSCLSCHENESEPRYSVKKPDTEVCFGCHTQQKNDWEAKKFIHGPVTLGKCAICHSPHASEYPFNLYKSSWDLCVNCHVEKGTGKHILGDSFSTDGHPTRDKPDPLRIGKELSCASCHDPHASNFLHLWAFEVQDIFELCTKCHYDK
jgi:predicted CXXCH cytochrome family protein